MSITLRKIVFWPHLVSGVIAGLVIAIMSRYQLFNRVDLQLNLNNISDELFYEQYYSAQAVPGEGRSANLTARVRF
jgi:outer membrane receptor for ferric coprogen and ferric-rhodotorulic acid